MHHFEPGRGPVTISMLNEGSNFQVFQALQSGKSAGAIRIDWNRNGVGLQTVVGHGHSGYLQCFERLLRKILEHSGRFTVATDFWHMPTYDTAFRTGETECLVKYRDKHEASHLLTQTKIVAMGVAVAAAQQGSVPHTNYKTRAEFEAAIARLGLPSDRPIPR